MRKGKKMSELAKVTEPEVNRPLIQEISRYSTLLNELNEVVNSVLVGRIEKIMQVSNPSPTCQEDKTEQNLSPVTWEVKKSNGRLIAIICEVRCLVDRIEV